MKSEIVLIDARLAMKWLADNATYNRPVRVGVVSQYAEMMKRGDWKLTHQGVAFDTHGILIDGQHRLMAIVKANVVVPMMVTRDTPEGAFSSIDCGVHRSVSDRLNINVKVAAILTCAINIMDGNNTKVPLTQIEALNNSYFGSIAHTLIKANNTTKRVMSTAPVAVAACVAIAEGEPLGFVLEQRRVLVNQDEDNETPSAKSFRRRFGQSRVTGSSKLDTEFFACALRVFEYESRNIKLIKLGSASIENARQRVRNAISTTYKEKN